MTEKKKITAPQQMVASCTGAVITSLLVTPLDVVKIRLQAQHKPFVKGKCFLYCNGLMDHLCVCMNGVNGMNSVQSTSKWYRPPKPHLNGTLDAFIKIARYEGITSLWSGLPPTLVMAVPATMVYFTVYDQIKYKMGYRENDPNTRQIPMLAGASARIVAATLISPLELVRTKMQSEHLSYTQLGRAVSDTVRHNGFLSLMKGLGPTLLRDVPFSAIYWFGYEYLKALNLEKYHSNNLTFAQSFTGGAISGTIASVLTLPFDVIKTHRQIELGEKQVMTGQKQVSSTLTLIMKLYRTKGPEALFAGLVPRVIKVAPACAIMISSYEFGKTFFQQRNAEHAQSSNSGR